MTEEKIIKHKHYSNNTELQTAYELGYKDGVTETTKKLEHKNNCLKEQIEKMINEIDKTIITSNMREREIYDIQEIFRKYDFRRNDNDKWELKE